MSWLNHQMATASLCKKPSFSIWFTWYRTKNSWNLALKNTARTKKIKKSCENAYCAQTMLRHRSHPLAHSSNINDEKRDVYTTRKKYHPYNWSLKSPKIHQKKFKKTTNCHTIICLWTSYFFDWASIKYFHRTENMRPWIPLANSRVLRPRPNRPKIPSFATTCLMVSA